MITRLKSVKRGAETRAAIVAVLTSAGKPLLFREIVADERVTKIKSSTKTLWAMFYTMTKSGLLNRSKNTPYTYQLPALPAPIPRARNTPIPQEQSTGNPVIQVDVDREHGRLKIKVHGDLTLDFGFR